MISFFSKRGQKELLALSQSHTLYAFDFDGTLAKIVPRPDLAKLNSNTKKLLIELSRLAPVAVISGRGIQDLKGRIPKEVHHLIGNHGLEGIKPQKSKLLKAKKICRAWKEQIENEWLQPGTEIEDKLYTLTLHYRHAKNPAFARRKLKKLGETLRPKARVMLGKAVINLIPEGAPHKGYALAKLLKKQKYKKAFYIGDDYTDEDIFQMARRDKRIMAVRVGCKKSSSAPYCVRTQSQVETVLKKLIKLQRQK